MHNAGPWPDDVPRCSWGAGPIQMMARSRSRPTVSRRHHRCKHSHHSSENTGCGSLLLRSPSAAPAPAAAAPSGSVAPAAAATDLSFARESPTICAPQLPAAPAARAPPPRPPPFCPAPYCCAVMPSGPVSRSKDAASSVSHNPIRWKSSILRGSQRTRLAPGPQRRLGSASCAAVAHLVSVSPMPAVCTAYLAFSSNPQQVVVNPSDVSTQS